MWPRNKYLWQAQFQKLTRSLRMMVSVTKTILFVLRFLLAGPLILIVISPSVMVAILMIATFALCVLYTAMVFCWNEWAKDWRSSVSFDWPPSYELDGRTSTVPFLCYATLVNFEVIRDMSQTTLLDCSRFWDWNAPTIYMIRWHVIVDQLLHHGFSSGILCETNSQSCFRCHCFY